MKVTFIEDRDGVKHAIIENKEGEFTSMSKTAYDEMIENVRNADLS